MVETRRLSEDEMNYVLSGLAISNHPIEEIRNSLDDTNRSDAISQLEKVKMIVNDETLDKLKDYIETLYKKSMFSNGTGLGARCASAIVGTQSQSNLDVKRLAASGASGSGVDVLSIMKVSKSPPDAGLYIVPSIPLRYDDTWKLAMSIESKTFSDYVVNWGLVYGNAKWWSMINDDTGKKYRLILQMDKNLIASTGVTLSNLADFFINNAIQKSLRTKISFICSPSPYHYGRVDICVDRYPIETNEFLVKDLLFRSYQNVMKKKDVLHGFQGISAVSVSSVPLMKALTFNHIKGNSYIIEIDEDNNMFNGICYREVLTMVHKFNNNAKCLCYNTLRSNKHKKTPIMVKCSEVLLNDNVYCLEQPQYEDGIWTFPLNQKTRAIQVSGVDYKAIKEASGNTSLVVAEYDVFNPNRITTRGGSLGQISPNPLIDEQMSYSIGVYPMYETLGLVCSRTYSLRQLIKNTGCDPYHSYAAASWSTKGPVVSSNEIGRTNNNIPITSSAISSAPLHIISACVSGKGESAKNPQVALMLGQIIKMGDSYDPTSNKGCELDIYGIPKSNDVVEYPPESMDRDDTKSYIMSLLEPEEQVKDIQVINVDDEDEDDDAIFMFNKIDLLPVVEDKTAKLI